MKSRMFHAWIAPVLLLGTMAYAIAEDVTLTTYYPSPRGVYHELRTTDNTYLATQQQGAVGIGTVTPVATLHVLGTAGVGNPDPYPVDLTVENNESMNTVVDLINRGQENAVQLRFLRGDFLRFVMGVDGADADKFKLGPPVQWGQNANLTIDSDGHVGIGTTAPGSRLSIHMQHNNEGIGIITRDGEDSFLWFWEGGEGEGGELGALLHYKGVDNSLELAATGLDGAVRFSTVPDPAQGLQERMRVASNGNVGIGTTTPAQTLTIRLNDTNDNIDDGMAIIGNPLDDGYVRFYHDNGATTVLEGFLNYKSDDHVLRLATGVGNAITFNTSTGMASFTERMRITSEGKVGIGVADRTENTDPTSELDVDGIVRASSFQQIKDRDNPDGPGSSVDLLPRGAILMFDSPGCPGGWTSIAPLNEGRLPLGHTSGAQWVPGGPVVPGHISGISSSTGRTSGAKHQQAQAGDDLTFDYPDCTLPRGECYPHSYHGHNLPFYHVVFCRKDF